MLKCESHLRVNVKVSEDLFFRVKKKNLFLFFIFTDLVLLNLDVLFYFFDRVSVTFAFCIPNIVYLNLCHWSNMYNYQSKKKVKNKQKKLRFVMCNTL